ncbi:MAG: ribosome small subunit-dependent GTPase A [Christensenellales bacterium]|jgi:ribosome biogenesis GTPase
MKKGKILKGVGGFYYVRDTQGIIHECKARGRFRKDGIVPLAGDNVWFSKDRFIVKIDKRENELLRPRVSNVSMAAIVVSAAKPNIDYMLCDKLLVSIKIAGITPLMVINKCDIANQRCINEIRSEYRHICETICVSAKSGAGLDELKERLSGQCTCFAGQSAAGKSSLLNALFSELGLEIGELSKKTDKGRHTTRQAKLLIPDEFDGIVIDTPGFSFFDSADIRPEQLWQYYDDMLSFAKDCKFALCLHAEEPDCGVKRAVSQGLISQNRYLRYLEILKELQEKRLKKYD